MGEGGEVGGTDMNKLVLGLYQDVMFCYHYTEYMEWAQTFDAMNRG